MAIPRYQKDLFGDIAPNLATDLDIILQKLVGAGRLSKGDKQGRKYKKFSIPANGMQLDMFLATPDNWGIIFAIRTGSGVFSKQLVTPRRMGGLLHDDYSVAKGHLWQNGVIVPTHQEQDVFSLLSCGWVYPCDREAVLNEHSKKGN